MFSTICSKWQKVVHKSRQQQQQQYHWSVKVLQLSCNSSRCSQVGRCSAKVTLHPAACNPTQCKSHFGTCIPTHWGYIYPPSTLSRSNFQTMGVGLADRFAHKCVHTTLFFSTQHYFLAHKIFFSTQHYFLAHKMFFSTQHYFLAHKICLG